MVNLTNPDNDTSFAEYEMKLFLHNSFNILLGETDSLIKFPEFWSFFH